jgi:hypothetical protein
MTEILVQVAAGALLACRSLLEIHRQVSADGLALHAQA